MNVIIKHFLEFLSLLHVIFLGSHFILWRSVKFSYLLHFLFSKRNLISQNIINRIIVSCSVFKNISSRLFQQNLISLLLLLWVCYLLHILIHSLLIMFRWRNVLSFIRSLIMNIHIPPMSHSITRHSLIILSRMFRCSFNIR